MNHNTMDFNKAAKKQVFNEVICKHKNRISDSAAYRYIFGALYAIAKFTKKALKFFLKHSIGILTVMAFTSVVIAANLFDCGELSFSAVVLFMLILTIITCAFIKFKIYKE